MNKAKYLIYLSFILLCISCRDNNELTMERGIKFYKNNKSNEAMQEFNNAIYSLSQSKKISTKERILLARAHYNLGLSHSKLHEYSRAINSVETAIQLDPKQEYFDTLKLLKTKIQ